MQDIAQDTMPATMQAPLLDPMLPIDPLGDVTLSLPDTPETADERLKRLERDVEIAQFTRQIADPARMKDAARILAQFETGTLSYANYRALVPMAQRVYVFQRGAAPTAPDTLRTQAKARAQTKARRQQAKASRRRNRA
jgi:hypothetical protein